MLERIRDIRVSEKRVYLRMREIFTLTANYQPDYKETTQFFKVIQNKLHFACTGHTAAEIIHARADANKPMMGLTHTSNGEVRKKDITVAKNYLNEAEISNLNRVVTMWLDFAEDQAKRQKQIFLRDWQENLEQFLTSMTAKYCKAQATSAKNRWMKRIFINKNPRTQRGFFIPDI